MRKRSVFLIVVVLQLGLVGYAAAQSDPVAWYEFEGDFTNSGTGTVVAVPRGGAVLEFDAGSILKDGSEVVKLYGNDEYVKVDNDDVDGITTAITVAAWVKSSGTNWSDAGIATRGYNWRLYVKSSDSAAFQCMDTEPKGSMVLGTTNINDDEWHHVAGTYDGARYVLYVEGFQDGPAVSATGEIQQTFSHKFAIGAFTRQSVVSKYYDGLIDDVRVYDYALSAEEIRQISGVAFPKATEPDPANRQTDVMREVTLSWAPGQDAEKHDIYFGTNIDDVSQASTTVDPNNVYKGRQDPSSYTVDVILDLETTYYWRIDEVNGAPDYTIFKGDVWQFTTEPFAYPLPGSAIAATSDSMDTDREPQDTIDSSGLDGDLHSNDTEYMWLSAAGAPEPSWILYEFDKEYKLDEMWVWNYNGESILSGFGLRDVTIEYSVDGEDYTTLGTTHEFAQAPGTNDYAHNTTISLAGLVAKYIKITANSNWGGAMYGQYGLSEVRFYYVPVRAREPEPAPGAANVSIDVVLDWRTGREAAEHKVYLGTDEEAVKAGASNQFSIPVTGLRDSYGPLSLDLGETYYWKVEEINEAEDTTTWESGLWSFTTPAFSVVDTMESYGEAETPGEPGSRIWYTWHDGEGWVEPTAVPGNGTGSVIELNSGTTHNTPQSMGYHYDNDGSNWYNTGGKAYYSEATANIDDLLAIGRDWTAAGVKTLTLYFYGDPENDADATEQMYVKLNGTKVEYDGDMADIKEAQWHEWNIELARFGIDLANVTTITIGFGSENNTIAGGSGVVYFDDIRLYPSRCIASIVKPEGDFNNDCKVDHLDLEMLGGDWLVSDYNATADAALLGFPADDSQWVLGRKGNALHLDGIDDRGYAGRAYCPTNAFTIALWINPDTELRSFSSRKDLIYWEFDSRPHLTFNKTGFGEIGLWPKIGADFDGPKTTTMFWNAYAWYHIAATFDGSDFKIYVNGNLEDTVNHPGTHNDASGLFIGSHRCLCDNNFAGRIDDLRIYDYALSGAEAASLGVGTADPATGPLFWYKFDETSGDVVNESVGTMVYVPVPHEDIDMQADGKINAKDLAKMAGGWLNEILWP